MSFRNPVKYIKSKYKYIHCKVMNNKEYWDARINGKFRCSYDSEREAAIAIDKYLISEGKEPVNILKKCS